MSDIFSNIEQQIENIDAKIEEIVKSATDSKNYEKLNKTINDMVQSCTNSFENGYVKAEKVVKAQSEKVKTSWELQQENLKRHSEAFKKPTEAAIKKSEKFKKKVDSALFARKDGVYVGGIALAIIGFILTGLSGLGMLVTWILHLALSFNVFIGINNFVLLPLVWISLLIAFIGLFMVARVKRFRKYIQVLAGGTQAGVSELARSVGRSVKFTYRELKNMIVANWFKEGYLTDDGETLIVSRVAYEAYKANRQIALDAQQQLVQMHQIHAQLPEQARVIVGRGADYLKEIHEKKVAISDDDLTIKLSNLETILKKIFTRVQRHPEVAPQMRRMMDYYVPTTVKLLEAYVQLDKQAVQGTNILVAKTEIEGSLDTLISAYEKLFDDLFKDVVLDVSTDISVLNTMLAQDGLANDHYFGNTNKDEVHDDE